MPPPLDTPPLRLQQLGLQTQGSTSPEATHHHASLFSQLVDPGDIIAMHGDLGAGKTEWVRGFCNAWGWRGDITSPTFTLLHEYPATRCRILHADLYRLKSAAEYDALELEERMTEQPSVLIVEWAERAPSLSRQARWIVHLETLDATQRMIRVTAR